MAEARWFIAILVVAARVEDAPAEAPLVDLQYRLIQATDAETAYRRALQLGASTNHSYRNSEGSVVSWNFAGLQDLCELGDQSLVDGTELYSRRVRRDPSQLAVAKEHLAVFWFEANKHRTARDILEDE
jgi:hypothetical protein